MSETSTITIRRSSRKTLALEITQDARILVRAPYRTSEYEIRRFVEKNQEWIRRHLARMQEKIAQSKALPPLSYEEVRRLAEEALKVIPERVAYYASVIGVTYGRITIRNQKTRWGSCSAKGNLNFNCLLMLTPPEILDYVVVHELCHRKEMNHSAAFWAEVESVLPDYAARKRWLKEEGGKLFLRLVR